MPTPEDMKNAYVKLTLSGIPPTLDNLMAETKGKRNDVLRLRNEYEAGVRMRESTGEDFSPAVRQIAFNLLRLVFREVEEQHSAVFAVRLREFDIAETALKTSLQTLSDERTLLMERVRVLEDENAALRNDLAAAQERLLHSESVRMSLEKQLEEEAAVPALEAPERQPGRDGEPKRATHPFAIRLEHLEATMSRFIAMVDENRTTAPSSHALLEGKAEAVEVPRTDPRQLDLDDAIREHLRKEASGTVEIEPTPSKVAVQEPELASSKPSADMSHEPSEEERDQIDGEGHAPTVRIELEHDEDHPRPDSVDVDVSEDLPDFLQIPWEDPGRPSVRF